MGMKEFQFANQAEMQAYVSVHHPSEPFIWKTNKDYLSSCAAGLRSYDRMNFRKSIIQHNHALTFNPIGIRSRFELAECYIRLSEYTKAKKALLAAAPYLTKKCDIYKFYQRLGHIFFECGQYRAAAACFLYSTHFGNSPAAARQLLYLVLESEDPSVIKIDAKQELSKNKIPILG